MKSLLTLLDSLIRECGEICSVDTTMDSKTVHRRFEHSGLPFLTIDLPSYEESLLLALDRGEVTPDLFLDFKKRQKLPVFLGGFMERVFDRASGAVLDNPDTDAIRSLRQITLLYKKIELPCSPDLVQRAFDRYVECDKEVESWENSHDEELLSRFTRLASLLFSREFHSVDLAIRDFAIRPKHGPGATADKKVANAKFEFDVWSDRCEAVFPFWWYATTSGYSTERISRVTFLEPGTEIPVKVIDVPKTQKTPRIIAIEPSYMQYLQQGIARELNTVINKSYLYDFVSNEFQEPNQLLALEGSISGNLATLDLSEASDRVSSLLVSKLFSGHPHLSDGVFATRSANAEVPGHGVLPLARFASMGSALCFPVETLVFFTCVLLGIEDAYGHRFTSVADVSRFRGRVRVYGDDIIVPTDTATSVTRILELFGFKVNVNKSFWTGKFRESCGKEYYAGADVSVARFRRMFPLSRKHVSELVSLVEFRNHLYFRGYWKTVGWLDEEIESLIPFPAVSDTSEVLGRHSFLEISQDRIGGRLQRPLVRGAVVRYRRRESAIDGEAALMKCLGFPNESDPVFGPTILETEKDHLLKGGRPTVSSINCGWHYSM